MLRVFVLRNWLLASRAKLVRASIVTLVGQVVVEIWYLKHLTTSRTFTQHWTFLETVHVIRVFIKSRIIFATILASELFVFVIFTLLFLFLCFCSRGVDVGSDCWFAWRSLSFRIRVNSVNIIKSFLQNLGLILSQVRHVISEFRSHLTIESHDGCVGSITNFLV